MKELRKSDGPVTAATHEWVCSRCVSAHDQRELGRRFRSGHETCPRCSNPGCGRVLVSKERTRLS